MKWLLPVDWQYRFYNTIAITSRLVIANQTNTTISSQVDILVVSRYSRHSLRKHAFSNILKFSPSKN